LVERRVVLEGAPIVEVPVHVADRGLDLAFGLGVLDPTRLRTKAIGEGKGQQVRMTPDHPPDPFADHPLGVVEEDRLGHAPDIIEGPGQRIEEGDRV
jgi:hypothetical protein